MTKQQAIEISRKQDFRKIDKTKKTISFSSDSSSYEIEDITVEEITKYKSQIVESFLEKLDL